MRFRSAKIQSEDSNWSVILNPLRSELDKKRVGEKIAELFRVSYEEARELVRNTPIILLDKLTHPEALQLQSILQGIRAEVTLTSNHLAKRRCFRAIWPENPDLSFLETPLSPAHQPVKEQGVEEAPLPVPVSTSLPAHFASADEGEKKEYEKKLKTLELLYEERTRENQELKRSLEEELKKHSDQAKEDHRTLHEDWEERYQGLKSEYQESKAIYEEKFLAQQNEFEVLKERVHEMENLQEKAAHLEKQAQELLQKLNQFESAKEELSRVVKERTDEVNLWREKYHLLAQKSERFESLYEGEKKRREQLEESVRQTAEMTDRIRRDLEIQAAETQRWREKFEELEENQKHLEKEFAQLSQEREKEVRELQGANRGLETQLESAQRQARDLLQRVEEQQTIERRMRLANELSVKEARIRELVLENERIRQEIQDRELHAQTLTSEQTDLEREILEIKQAQRHLLEQSKMKEKGSKLTKRPHSESSRPAHANPSLSGQEKGEWELRGD